MPNGIRLPVKLPFNFKDSNYTIGIQLPVRLPFQFKKISTEDISYRTNLPIKITPIGGEENKALLKISVKPTGTPVYLPISETVWSFSGLLVDENIIVPYHNSLLVDEKIYTEIIPSFELLSLNQLKIGWSGTKVPRVEIYIKSLENEEYSLYGTYSWNRGSIILPIENHSYYVKIQGIRDSGSSEEYLVNSPLQIGISPELEMVKASDKIYNVDIDYTNEYKIEVEY